VLACACLPVSLQVPRLRKQVLYDALAAVDVATGCGHGLFRRLQTQAAVAKHELRVSAIANLLRAIAELFPLFISEVVLIASVLAVSLRHCACS
jgi:hypothetical protein